MAKRQLETQVFEKKTIVGMGEILWDIFPSGPRFGGAPANFACSAAGLAGEQCQVYMVSGVGDDALGRRAQATLRQHRVDSTYLQRLARPTGQVDITLDSAGNATYKFASDSAWDNLSWNSRLRQLALRSEVVCFGTLGQRCLPSAETIRQFVSTTAADCIRIFDINLRAPFFDWGSIRSSMTLANVLKINDDELEYVADREKLTGAPDKLISQLAERYGLDCVALTMGEKGSLLLKDGGLSHAPAEIVRVADTVGAGDAFCAALALGLLAGDPLESINEHASRVAAYVCSQDGANPVFPSALRRSA